MTVTNDPGHGGQRDTNPGEQPDLQRWNGDSCPLGSESTAGAGPGSALQRLPAEIESGAPGRQCLDLWIPERETLRAEPKPGVDRRFTTAPDNPRGVAETKQSSPQMETGMPTKKVEPSGNKGLTGEHQPQASPSAEPQLPSEHR